MKNFFNIFIIFAASLCLGKDFTESSEEIMRAYPLTGWSAGYPVYEKLWAQHEAKRGYCSAKPFLRVAEPIDVNFVKFTEYKFPSFLSTEGSLLEYLKIFTPQMVAFIRVAQGLKNLGGEYIVWSDRAYAFLNERTHEAREACAAERAKPLVNRYPAMFTNGGGCMVLLTSELKSAMRKGACGIDVNTTIKSWSEDVWYIMDQGVKFIRKDKD